MSIKSRPLGTNATGLPFAPRWATAGHGCVFLAGACRLGGRVQLSYVAWLLSVFPVSHKHRKVPPSTCYLRYIASSSEDRRDAPPPRCNMISRLPVHAPRLGCLSGARTDHGHAHPGGLKDLSTRLLSALRHPVSSPTSLLQAASANLPGKPATGNRQRGYVVCEHCRPRMPGVPSSTRDNALPQHLLLLRVPDDWYYSFLL